MSRVLVTGGTGFLGGHTILQLLQAGHEVRTTLRDPKRQSEVRESLGTAATSRLSFWVADLLNDSGWAAAVRDCDYVLHVASPFPGAAPKHEDELIIPARDGTLRVLRAARDAGVRRCVVTSSFGAVGYGQAPRKEPFNEQDWTNTAAPAIAPYIKSKTVAERAAWEFIANEGGQLELTVINPVGIFGPLLGRDYPSSIGLVKSLLEGAMPATPRIYFGVVDVRDVADLHLRAMTSSEANGRRFIAVAGPALPLHEVAMILRRRLGAAAKRVPRLQFPDALVRLLARFSPALQAMLPQLGIVRNSTSDAARTVLGWSARSAEEAIVASGESLIRMGLL